MAVSDETNVRAAADTAARQSYGKLVAFLAARSGDVAGAEDALSEAFEAALTEWPKSGTPDRPEAWLLAVARRRMIDGIRRQRTSENASPHVRLIAEELNALETGAAAIPDERLALMFACAHPAIDASVRAPLILQTILGFDAGTIASAFLVSPATMAQRLVRAKSRIRLAGIPFRIPERDDLRDRLDGVLEAIYATFAEGWADPTGTDPRRGNLAQEGIWVGRLVVNLLPDEPEALGLLALMLHSEARRAARRNINGDYVPLTEQDTNAWNVPLIEEGDRLLRRASHMGLIGRYQLEAAVQSAHAVRRVSGRSDWAAIAVIYDSLVELTQSPVAAINRAVAIAETRGTRAGLSALDALAENSQLQTYQPYWAARASLLARIDPRAAADAYDKAIGLEADPAVRRFLQDRKAALI